MAFTRIEGFQFEAINQRSVYLSPEIRLFISHFFFKTTTPLVFSQVRDEEEAFLDWSDDDDDGFDPSTLPDPDKYRSSEESDSEDLENKIRYVFTFSRIKYMYLFL